VADTKGIRLELAAIFGAPNGAAVIRSNCDTERLREMAAMLIEIANQLQGEAKLN
jgi:hypothetical protein